MNFNSVRVLKNFKIRGITGVFRVTLFLIIKFLAFKIIIIRIFGFKGYIRTDYLY